MKQTNTENNRTKKKSGSLRRNLFFSFAVFTIVFIALLWIFQVGTLNATYKLSRYRNIIRNGREVVAAVSSSYDERSIEGITIQQDTGVIIDNGSGRMIRTNPRVTDNMLNPATTDAIMAEISKLEIGEEKVFYVNAEGTRMDETRSISNYNRGYLNAKATVIIYGTRAKDYAGNTITVLTIGSLVPVDATAATLRTQLVYVTFILLGAAAIVAYLSSRHLAKPITQINEDAKRLAKGDYDTEFHGEGYAEIEELSDTLNQMADDLGRADRIQKDLIANVSHDLRTPLTMISGYGELMRDIPNENTPENVQVIIDESNRLTSLVNNLLDISKLQSGNEHLNIAPINANELIYNAANSYQKLMDAKGYSFEIDGEEQTYYVAGDMVRIQQVLYNLLNNALNHCGEDKTIVLGYHKVGNNIRFDVIDHGEGIAEADQQKIFDRYYKANNQSRFVAGSGLGLSIVKTIMELHGSKYGVSSKLGKGADFYFELPIVDN